MGLFLTLAGQAIPPGLSGLPVGQGVIDLLRFGNHGPLAAGERFNAPLVLNRRSVSGSVGLDQFVGVADLSGASGLSVLTSDLLDAMRPLRLRLPSLPGKL